MKSQSYVVEHLHSLPEKKAHALNFSFYDGYKVA